MQPEILLAISIPSADLPEAVGPIIKCIMQELIYSKEEVHKLISLTSQKASNSSVFFLHGEIGTGKTFLVREFLQSFGVKETITSPTFSIFNEYETPTISFFHYDLYRLKKASELMFVDIEENLNNGTLIIEWPELAREFGIVPTVEIFLSYTQNPNTRKATILFCE